MLDVIVPGQAAEHHHGSEPQGQAVGVGACRENMREAQILVAGLTALRLFIRKGNG